MSNGLGHKVLPIMGCSRRSLMKIEERVAIAVMVFILNKDRQG
jgi:hypothetical protein